MRHEGSLWVGYYALPDTMNDALFLGSIRMALVQDPNRKAAFMDLMREAVGDIIEEKTGHRPEWPHGVQPAPEHERGGQG
jgi:hypothetical protein